MATDLRGLDLLDDRTMSGEVGRPAEVPLAFLDIETTGLDPVRHEIWEVALVIRHPVGTSREGEEDQYVWQLPVDLSRADPIALNIGRFHDRRWPEPEQPHSVDDGLVGEQVVPAENLPVWAASFAELTRGAHLVGNLVSFDADRLERLLRRYGQTGRWYHHVVDVKAMAAGYLGMAPLWDGAKIRRAFGVELDEERRHTALGDAVWARDMFDAVLGAGTLARSRNECPECWGRGWVDDDDDEEDDDD